MAIALAIVLPICAFVALGFEHSVANMYLIPVAMLAGAEGVGVSGFIGNMVPVTLGNIVGGGVFVALVYWLIYLHGQDRDPVPAGSLGAPARSETGGGRFMTGQPAKLHEITEILGDIEAAKAEAILATGATVAEIEEAQAWAAGESDVMGGDLARPLSGPVAAVFEILSTEEPLDDRD